MQCKNIRERLEMRMFLYILVFQWTAIISTRGDGELIDATGETIKDLNSFCKNKPCIAKYCTEPNKVLVTYNMNPQTEMKCQTLEELKNSTKRVFNISAVDKVHKWEHTTYLDMTNKSLLTDFQYITFVNKSEIWENQLERKYCAVLEDGSLSMKLPHVLPRFEVIPPGKFMVDFVILAKLYKSKLVFSPVKLRCAKFSNEEDEIDYSLVFISIGMLVSSLFLAALFIIYWMLPQLRTLNGLTIMAYTASLTISFAGKAALSLVQIYGNLPECQIWYPIQYFFTLSTFFWLNVMAFDTCWCFRGSFKALTSNRSGIKRKFYIYCLYGFGSPLLITATVTIIDTESQNENVLKPMFSHCITGGYNYLIFFYTPMVVLMIVNFIFFLVTAYNLWRINKANDKVTRCPESKTNVNQKNRFYFLLKLAIVTGLYWIFEIITSLEINKVIEVILDIYIAFVGLLIFGLFICRRSVLIPLCVRLSIFPEYTESFRNKHTNRSMTKSMLSKRKTSTFNSISMVPMDD